MRRELIITVAGTSSRFSQSLGREQVKCIYYEKDYKESLLYRLVTSSVGFDAITIVGGYHFHELKAYIDTYLSKLQSQLYLVENPHFKDYGSGYSLYLGLQEAFLHHPTEIVFAEGDLWLDEESFQKVCEERSNVITINQEPILAKKAVALYTDAKDQLHYIYDTSHGSLQITEPFHAIYNSGQVWKFVDVARLKDVLSTLNDIQLQGTNLEMINAYFGGLAKEEYSIISFKRWINANTIEDYQKAWREGE